ncbi:hypothetical protein WDJ51_13945, partial [Rathayibacter sp. YIM 133350]|uniref:hypothetical protein n=1 Tax=Rathayibacter sp. YIM 133350 TaxID=3131992 RepID=UPI00307F5F90
MISEPVSFTETGVTTPRARVHKVSRNARLRATISHFPQAIARLDVLGHQVGDSRLMGGLPPRAL